MFLFDRIFGNVVHSLLIYLRPFIKWFLHTFTRLTELQRICYGAKAGASRTRSVENSLQLSNNKDIKDLLRELNEAVEFCNEEELLRLPARAVNVVMKAKRIKTRCHPDFYSLFGACVLQIYSYRRLVYAVERLRSEAYDSENPEHERKLLELWHCLMPDQKLNSRVTKQWQQIGFQGDDPKTDFRGMGMLGLENLLYFSKEYREAAQHVLLHSNHPIFGYTFAIVGINLTSMAYRLLKSGDAKTHFYNVGHNTKRPCLMRQFHEFYSFLLFEFDRFWLESEPQNIMDFRDIYQSFEITILEALHNDATVFKTNLIVEHV